ncbi:hypothetical protein PSTT_12018 [Puccinia striiformis]|uniref:Uncharacterized protein n=1 Tax=Puccinia striiformis TaxID=27350 RepID=A0A2S4UYA4_9BASI|nr:hypothetical protein PSTT_12018 [Puccinia striiformis]
MRVAYTIPESVGSSPILKSKFCIKIPAFSALSPRLRHTTPVMVDPERSDGESYESSSSADSFTSYDSSWHLDKRMSEAGKELKITTGATLRGLDKLILLVEDPSFSVRKPITELSQEAVKRKSNQILKMEVDLLPAFQLELKILQDSLGLQKDPRMHPETCLESTYQGLLKLTIITKEHLKLSEPESFDDSSVLPCQLICWNCSHIIKVTLRPGSSHATVRARIDIIQHSLKEKQSSRKRLILSDFTHLQENWSQNIPELEEVLSSLTARIYDRKSTHDHQETVEQFVGLAKKIIPLVKLIRTLINKISNPWKKKSTSFRLDTELDSKTLSKLQDLPRLITVRFSSLITFLLKAINEFTNDELNEIRGFVTDKISKEVNNFILVLALNITPIDRDFDRHSLESNYKDWFLTWKQIWDTALSNFSDALAEAEENDDTTPDLTLGRLDELIRQFRRCMNVWPETPVEELPQDVIDSKIKKLESLEEVLLPKFKLGLGRLLRSLDLQKDATELPTPQFESTITALQDIEETSDHICKYIQEVFFLSPVAEYNDFHLGRCKAFITGRAFQHTRELLEDELTGYFSQCRAFIKSWKKSKSAAEKARSAATKSKLESTFETGDRLSKMTNNFYQSVDSIIYLLRSSDYEILQENWREAIGTLDENIESLTRQTHHGKIPKSKPIQPDIQDEEIKKRSADLNRFIVLAKSVILLNKLARTLLNKITNDNPKKMTFTLTTELNSETLEDLLDIPRCFTLSLERLTVGVLRNVTSNTLYSSEAEIQKSIDDISKQTDSLLVLLGFHLVPFDRRYDRRSIITNFPDWFRTWKEMWYEAVNHFLDALSDCQGEENRKGLLSVTGSRVRLSWGFPTHPGQKEWFPNDGLEDNRRDKVSPSIAPGETLSDWQCTHQVGFILASLSSSSCSDKDHQADSDTAFKDTRGWRVGTQARTHMKECIQSATLLIPVDTYDHHLKVFKRFRMRRLVELASGLIESHIPKLFTNCMEMITGNLSTPARGIPRGQPGLPSDLRREVLRETRQCHVITNVIIGWSKISDLEVLKNAWVGGIESLSDIEITDEEGLLHLTIVGRTSQSAHGKLITELAQRTILLIKLMRVLWNKISEGSPTNPPFALDRELNSKTLSLLDNSPAYIVDRFGVVAQKLFGIHHDLDDDNGVYINTYECEEMNLKGPYIFHRDWGGVIKRLGFLGGKMGGIVLPTTSRLLLQASKPNSIKSLWRQSHNSRADRGRVS